MINPQLLRLLKQVDDLALMGRDTPADVKAYGDAAEQFLRSLMPAPPPGFRQEHGLLAIYAYLLRRTLERLQ